MRRQSRKGKSDKDKIVAITFQYLAHNDDGYDNTLQSGKLSFTGEPSRASEPRSHKFDGAATSVTHGYVRVGQYSPCATRSIPTLLTYTRRACTDRSILPQNAVITSSMSAGSR